MIMNKMPVKIAKAFYRTILLYTPLTVVYMPVNLIFTPFLQRKSWRELTVVGEKFGLEYESSPFKTEFGKLTGTIREHNVEVIPDQYRSISVSFRERKQLNLSTGKPLMRPTEGLIEFDTDDGEFNSTFRTKHASTEIASRFQSDGNLTRKIQGFYNNWLWYIDTFKINEFDLICQFNTGQPFIHYIPASIADRALTDLLSLADYLDEQLR